MKLPKPLKEREEGTSEKLLTMNLLELNSKAKVALKYVKQSANLNTSLATLFNFIALQAGSVRTFFKFLLHSKEHGHHLLSFFEDFYSEKLAQEKEETQNKAEESLVKQLNNLYEGVSAQVLSLLTVEHYKQLRKLMTKDLLGRKVVKEAKIKPPLASSLTRPPKRGLPAQWPTTLQRSLEICCSKGSK